MGTHPVSAGIAKREIDLRHKIVFVLGALPTKTWLVARILIIPPKCSRDKLATRSLMGCPELAPRLTPGATRSLGANTRGGADRGGPWPSMTRSRNW